MPLYDLQAVQRDKWNLPILPTDLVTSSKKRIANRAYELKRRRQQFRVLDETGWIFNEREIFDWL